MRELRTQVAIVGAGPAGLLLGHMLHLEGIDNVILEHRSREYVEKRVRAGVIEFGIANLLEEVGAGERMRREGLVHHGIELRYDHQVHRIPLSDLADGRAYTVYGQQEVVKDLIELRLAQGEPLYFETEVTDIEKIDTNAPFVDATNEGEHLRVHADFVAGCDGSFGASNRAIPSSVLRRHERVYPFSWLGILAEAPPATEELIYGRHEEGFVLYSMRSPTLSRLYLGVRPEDTLEQWSDERIWEELARRLSTDQGSKVNRGPIIDRGITAMRSVVVEPMSFGRLFLAGDAAHIVPPTGAKGMNLALADVRVLTEALRSFYSKADERLLDAYSATCLERVWRAEEFSNYMTQMLHPNYDDGFENGVQHARLRQATQSREAATVLSRNYVDLNSL
ncbi:MAG: 4-hydroxybenzoate 3-monooxygenase [Acidimicrobiales bacterium]|jgi:p-hydroxybenzoate 3-monooxygenase